MSVTYKEECRQCHINLKIHNVITTDCKKLKCMHSVDIQMELHTRHVLLKIFFRSFSEAKLAGSMVIYTKQTNYFKIQSRPKVKHIQKFAFELYINIATTCSLYKNCVCQMSLSNFNQAKNNINDLTKGNGFFNVRTPISSMELLVE